MERCLVKGKTRRKEDIDGEEKPEKKGLHQGRDRPEWGIIKFEQQSLFLFAEVEKEKKVEKEKERSVVGGVVFAPQAGGKRGEMAMNFGNLETDKGKGTGGGRNKMTN